MTKEEILTCLIIGLPVLCCVIPNVIDYFIKRYKKRYKE